MDLSQATNAITPLCFGGQEVGVRQLKLREWGTLHAWLTASRPNPVHTAAQAIADSIKMGMPFSAEVRDHLLTHAHDEARRWPPPMGGAAWLRELCATAAGEREFYRAVFAAAGYTFEDDDALDVMIARAAEEETADVVRLAMFGDPPSPKATPPVPVEVMGEFVTGGLSSTP